MMSDISFVANRVLGAFRRWRGQPGITQVLEDFPRLEVFVAGGVVRNLVLDPEAKVKDFDLFFSGDEMSRAFERLAQIGRITRGVYGNIHWYPAPDEPVRGDLIPVTNFDWVGRSETMRDALRQFDFTGNAIAVELRTGAVLDPVGGVRDLQHRLMRAIRYDWIDDPIVPGHALRRPVCIWYRILHYAAALGLEIEPQTMSWLLEHRAYSAYREAFTQEFKKPHPNALLVYDLCA
jgi:tRNA nucleotidyltransferase/poly(A) polymerase